MDSDAIGTRRSGEAGEDSDACRTMHGNGQDDGTARRLGTPDGGYLPRLAPPVACGGRLAAATDRQPAACPVAASATAGRRRPAWHPGAARRGRRPVAGTAAHGCALLALGRRCGACRGPAARLRRRPLGWGAAARGGPRAGTRRPPLRPPLRPPQSLVLALWWPCGPPQRRAAPAVAEARPAWRAGIRTVAGIPARAGQPWLQRGKRPAAQAPADAGALAVPGQPACNAHLGAAQTAPAVGVAGPAGGAGGGAGRLRAGAQPV